MSPVGSYAQLWRARWQLVRPGNAIQAAVGVFVGMALAASFTTPWHWAMLDTLFRRDAVLWAPVAALLITGFGNTINDLRDCEIDALGHPERPLPSGAIRAADAKAWAVLLAAFGLLAAIGAGGVALGLFAAFNIGLLALYELWAKARGLPGNLLVALLVASTFLFGAVAWALSAGDLTERLLAVAPLAAMAGLANLAREGLKDIEDLEADAGRRTWPMVAGEHTVRRASQGAVLLACALAVGYAWQSQWDALAWSVLAISLVGFMAGAALAGVPGRAQRLWKLAMWAALVAFLL